MKMNTRLHDLPLEVAASAFAALGSEQRLTVLRTLVRAGPEGLSIGELGEKTGVTGSTLTHHMRILTQAGLARQAKRGLYREILHLCAHGLCHLLGHDHETDDGTMKRLERRLLRRLLRTGSKGSAG